MFIYETIWGFARRFVPFVRPADDDFERRPLALNEAHSVRWLMRRRGYTHEHCLAYIVAHRRACRETEKLGKYWKFNPELGRKTS